MTSAPMELQEPRGASNERNNSGRGTAGSSPEPTWNYPLRPSRSGPRNPNILTNAIKPFTDWWCSWVSRTINNGPASSGGDPRDYLALERTFLGWVRTSLTLISLGVVVTQLFVLQSLDRTKGIVIGCALTCGGMVIIVGAAFRYFRAQELLSRGKALTGGWEAIGLWFLLVVVIGMLFLVVIIET